MELKQYFDEFNKHLLEDDKPSQYFEGLLQQGLLNKTAPFTLLGALAKTPQSLQHHPEGNVWKHTMLVLDQAAKHKNQSSNARVLMWAALLHDLGKPGTTKNRKGKITSYDHDKLGAKLTIKFLEALTEEGAFICQVTNMVRWHMQTLFVVKNLPFAEVELMLQQVKLEEIALLSLCDRLGRGELTADKEKEERAGIALFIKKVKKAHGYRQKEDIE